MSRRYARTAWSKHRKRTISAECIQNVQAKMHWQFFWKRLSVSSYTYGVREISVNKKKVSREDCLSVISNVIISSFNSTAEKSPFAVKLINSRTAKIFKQCVYVFKKSEPWVRKQDWISSWHKRISVVNWKRVSTLVYQRTLLEQLPHLNP